MDRFAKANASFKVDGYYLARNNESAEVAFERAKKECAQALRDQIADIEQLDLKSFVECRKKGFRA